MALMDFNLGDIGGVFTSIREAITGEKIKDPAEMAKITLQLSQLESMANQGQISINKIEAAHKSLFVAGWRPFIGWVCGVAIAYAFVLQPIIEWVVVGFELTQAYTEADGSVIQVPLTTPKIETDALFELVIAMLGMATLRTYEKQKLVSREK